MESGENINENAEESPSARVGTLENPSALGANPDLPGFTQEGLDKHFGSGFDSDHSEQYPHFTKEQYAQRAHDLVRSATDDHILGYRTDNGNVVRFDESTNDFVKCSIRRSRILTMFKPDEETRYFERQLLRDGGMTDD